MRVLTIVHQPDAGPGVFAGAIHAAGHELVLWEPARAPAPDLRSYGALLALGGGMHPDQEAVHPWLAAEKRLLGRALEDEVPLLAVCLGAELLAEAAGGASSRAAAPEIGWHSVHTTDASAADPVLGELPARFEALEWHSYACALPPGAVALARNEAGLQAFRAGERAWGIQFHAEVTLETFESWLNDYRADPDAVAAGIDPETLRRQTRAEIGPWNRLGHELCARFLGLAGERPAVCDGAPPGKSRSS